jgi:hypothetical protein
MVDQERAAVVHPDQTVQPVVAADQRPALAGLTGGVRIDALGAVAGEDLRVKSAWEGGYNECRRYEIGDDTR